jgi:hypothetical protein
MLHSLGRRREASAAFDTVVTRAVGGGMMRTLVGDGWATGPLINRAAVAGDSRVAALLRELTPSRNAKMPKSTQTLGGDSSGREFNLTNPALFKWQDLQASALLAGVQIGGPLARASKTRRAYQATCDFVVMTFAKRCCRVWKPSDVFVLTNSAALLTRATLTSRCSRR